MAPLAAAATLGSREDAEAAPPLAFQAEKSGLKITGVRLVEVRGRRQLPQYKAEPTEPEVAKILGSQGDSQGRMHNPNVPIFPGVGGAFTVEITTDKGVTGFGRGGNGGPPHVQGLSRYVIGEDPFDVTRLWDRMYQGSLAYGMTGAVIHAISGIDLALWDIIGKATGMPVYKLIGGETKTRIPSYATLNDIRWKKEIGFTKIKLALPFGTPGHTKPVREFQEGLRRNTELVKYIREQLGPNGEIMLDCWMALTEPYTLELAEAVAPYRVNWIEEPLMADDYEGHARLKARINTCRITTGEHLYTRYQFRRLAEHSSAHVWQPDIQWAGGLTELRRIAAIAAAYDIPVIPHLGGSSPFATHFIMATPNSPWAEFFWPPAGGPPEVYKQWEEEHQITRGPEGIYTRPLDRPGFGWDVVVA